MLLICAQYVPTGIGPSTEARATSRVGRGGCTSLKEMDSPSGSSQLLINSSSAGVGPQERILHVAITLPVCDAHDTQVLLKFVNGCLCFLSSPIVAGTPGPCSKHVLPDAVSMVNKQGVEGGPLGLGHSRAPRVIFKRSPLCRQEESVVLGKTELCS